MLLEEVFQHLESHEYQAGDALMREGDPGDGLFVLLSGSSHASLRDSDAPIGRFGPGDVVGEMALVTREPRTADVVADTPIRALKLPVAAFDRLVARHPVLAKVLTDVVADRLGRGSHDGLGGKAIDRYVIERCIGRGGMAIVYHARDAETGEPIALKMMSHRLVYEAGALTRFHQEAELLRSLDHPNIASLHRLFPAYNTYFLVMELCDGVDLERLIAAHGPFGESHVRPILGQLAVALEYVHERGVIHRDLKPSNVMLTRGGAVKLMDFGLATTVVSLGDDTRMAAGAFEGTPAFMAPEQLSNVQLDRRADIYALAGIAYTLLTGRPIFRSGGLFELVQEKLTFRLPPAPQIGDGISSDLHTFMTRALDPNRETRLASLRMVADWAAPIDSALLKPA